MSQGIEQGFTQNVGGMMTATTRVLLADDHPLVRAGIRSALASNDDIFLIGEAVDGPSTLAFCATEQPDVVLLDLNMPNSAPFATVTRLRAECPQTQIIVLTAYDDDAYVRGLTAAGISGYILKEEALEVVSSAIQSVVRGGTWFSRGVALKLADRQADSISVRLTNRERQLLSLLVTGQDARQLAATLCLSEQTIRNYLSRLYDKLDVNSRAEAICWARDNNFSAA
jgi:DNA-binding NarL/FixJ family response regulator